MSATHPYGDPISLAIAEAVKRAVAEALAQHEAARQGPPAPDAFDLQRFGLEPLRAYRVEEAARLLGTSESAVYKIDEAELPRVRRNGSAIGFLGIHIMGYMHRLPPVDVAGCVERMRERLLEQAEAARPTAIRALHAGRPGKTKVL